ncbi:MAG: hypothetical protein AAFV80_02105 [Bacteroidota bacterium]
MRYLFFVLLLSIAACQNATEESTQEAVLTGLSEDTNTKNAFNEYWYNGEAELSSYSLQQARYGEVHKGEAVMVFVTEPFSKKNHTKADNAPASDKVNILKLNMTKKFYTGIYPYSMMLSAFTPIDRANDGPSMRVTCTSQEWCGHTFTQLDYRNKAFEMMDFSYFPSEGDRSTKLSAEYTEDELFNLIRINPELLPTGELTMVPGTFIFRLKHLDLKTEKAVASLQAHPTEKDLQQYRVEWPGLNRDLTIDFQSQFPYTIEGWEENYSSGWGPGAKKLRTKATRKKTIMLDYWSRNAVSDGYLREALELLKQ